LLSKMHQSICSASICRCFTLVRCGIELLLVGTFHLWCKKFISKSTFGIMEILNSKLNRLLKHVPSWPLNRTQTNDS
jgi:hypothetical protein